MRYCRAVVLSKNQTPKQGRSQEVATGGQKWGLGSPPLAMPLPPITRNILFKLNKQLESSAI